MSYCILDRFKSRVDEAADAIAVMDGEQHFSYRQLDDDSERLATHLRQSGLGKDCVAALYLPRSYQMIVAVVGVLKSGACYLPLDSSYPPDRLRYMLADAGAATLITSKTISTEALAWKGSVLLLDDLPSGNEEVDPAPQASSIADDSLAYLIYTSGSTGQPKGVAMEHGPLRRLIEWQLSESQQGQGGRTLQFSPLSFDVSFQEIFATLCSGGTLVTISNEDRLDGRALLDCIEQAQINRLFMPFVALQMLADSANQQQRYPDCLRELVTAGEALQINKSLRRFFEQMPQCSLQNQYGPSESHVVSAYRLEGPVADWPALPPIGKTLPHVEFVLWDEEGNSVAEGETGEIVITGPCLARGYMNQPDMTAERFVERDGMRYYKTGDLGRKDEHQNFHYLGRKDGQVKVRGYRVELGEIEVSLAEHPQIEQAVVDLRRNSSGHSRLVGWYRGAALPVGDLQTFLLDTLPDYMVPAVFIRVEDFPRTASGKIDRRALPNPDRQRPALLSDYRAPESDLEKQLVELWEGLLEVSPVGVDDNFFELGGNSLLALQFVDALETRCGWRISPVDLFSRPTIAGLAAMRAQTSTRSTKPAVRKDEKSRAIAIIGMAGRFPGAENIDEFWRNLLDGRESVRFFSAEELGDKTSNDPNFVAAKGVLERPARFDAEFFGISPREAEIIDPQQRVLLELAWQAMEDAGYAERSRDERVGVFAGSGNNSYHANNIAGRQDLVERMGDFNLMVANEKDYVATRIAHKLDLNGPALSIHTACSTSLVAIHMAVQSLRAGECELAIAGGASVSSPQCEGYLYQEGGILSGDGHCRPFDAAAAGTIFSDGAALVVLKPLEQALEDGDHIYAVIEGSAINNDGGNKASFTAPNPDGQRDVILAAQEDAGISADAIGYVEAHGTATPLGDPIEVQALSQAFAANGGGRDCVLGSVKSNFGHLTAAAGVAGLIKTALILQRGVVPPTLHFRKASPTIDWHNSPFRVNAATEQWRREGKRVAAVSSFGVGGTNAHLVLSQPPPPQSSGSSRPWHLLLMSHRSEEGLAQHEAQLADALEGRDASLADVAFSLNGGRRRFACNSVVIAAEREQAVKALRERPAAHYRRLPIATARSKAAFMFPGQGAQVAGMAQALYEGEAIFQNAVDECATYLRSLLGEDIRQYLYPELFAGDSNNARNQLTQTLYAQLSLFIVEYSLARLWMYWGVRPAILFGHSIGEWTAACVAGCVELKDALRAVCHRGQLMQAQPSGAMLSVRASSESLASRLPPELEIAAVNSANSTVVAGPKAEIEAFASRCEREGLAMRLLDTSHAFHSHMMDAAAEKFAAAIADISFSRPTIPFISCVTGELVQEAQWSSPDYWARQIRLPVQCAQAMKTIDANGPLLALELGPGKTLSTLFAQNESRQAHNRAIATLGSPATPDKEWQSTLLAVAEVEAACRQVDWRAFYSFEKRQRVPLPAYPFQGTDYWLPELSATSSAGQVQTTAPAPARKGLSMTDQIRSAVRNKVVSLIEELSGLDISSQPDDIHLLEAGLDSLLLTQTASTLRREFQIELSFRQLLEDFASLAELVDYIHDALGPEQRAAFTGDAQPAEDAVEVAVAEVAAPYEVPAPSTVSGSLEALIQSQLQLMSRQLDLLGGKKPQSISAGQPVAVPVPTAVAEQPSVATERPPQKAFGAQTRIETRRYDSTLPDVVRENLERFMETYMAKTPGSREFTQRNRRHLADPRAVSGFTPLLKEMVYPIVVKGSDGARLWDVDGNEYIDLINGFGSNFLGHGPDCVKQALHRQIEAGFEIGPQTPLAAEVAALLCELTGMERAALCNTGSEAVMGAVRLARTVSGRDRVVVFDGAYHGINDEVIVRAGKNASMPAAAGIPLESVGNVVVLEYGSDEALDYIRQHGDSLAAVLVEPVQSRRPEFQPGRFLTALRAATLEADIALIFDEVITGFRICPGGAQEYFGVRADLATYGKIIGGGMPIGAIVGSAKYMDALDGGWWSFGDDSMPEVGVTYFAGTFVRHPLAMAAAKAALGYLKEQGPQLQRTVNEKTEALCEAVNHYYGLLGFPFKLNYFGSLFKVSYDESQSLGSLFFYKLRELGVHIWEGRPSFITVAHSDEDIAFLENCFKAAADFMLQNSFISGVGLVTTAPANTSNAPQAKLLTDEQPSQIVSTEAQREVWLAAQMGEEANCAFNESLSLRLRGHLERDALKAALTALQQRHDALRARFSEDGRNLIIDSGPVLQLDEVDCRGMSRDESAAAETEARELSVATPFNLDTGPLLRFQLLRFADEEHLLVVTAHHAICDGWSLYMMVRELASLYNHQLGGPVLEPASRFADYAAWEQSEAIQSKHQESLEYWRSKLRDGHPFLEWPLDKSRPALRGYSAQRLDHAVASDFIPKARQIAARQRTTLTAVLMAGFAAFSHRLSGQSEILFGLPFAGQLAKEDLDLVGHCVNVLPIKIRVSANDTFQDLLQQVQEELRGALRHQYLTFGTLLQSLEYKRDPSRPALLSTLFNVDLNDPEPLPFCGLTVDVESNPRQFENFDMNFNITVTADQAVVECTFNTELWHSETMELRLREFETMLSQAFSQLDSAVGELPLLPADEHEGLMSWAQGPQQEIEVETLVELLDLFRHAGRNALRWGDEVMSFGELDQRSNRLANYLRRKDVKDGTLVGVLLERSPELLVSLLAVWKAGAAYVPLDPAYPGERLRYMLDASGAELLVSTSDLLPLVEPASCTAICLDREAANINKMDGQPPQCQTQGDDPAYVIFTSGSTGKPKGVEVPHKAVVNFLCSMAQHPGLSASDRVLALTTLSFDIAVLELYLPLVCGAEIVMTDRESALDGYLLKELIEDHRITVMQATPATWRLLLAAEWQPEPGFKVLCGGEAFPLDLARVLVEAGADVWNMYGPTETTVWSTCHPVEEADLDAAVPVGRPIHNTQCYVLDANLKPTPVGVPGELFIGGDGVATGYLGQAGLTAERFIPNPFGEGYLYRSGDQACWRKDGTLLCLGRLDSQVKLRGFRIELGELEAKLAQHPQVLECAAAVRSYGEFDQRLVAYIRLREGAQLNATELRSHLRESLPEYMIPQLFTEIESLPLTANGKLDRKALPDPIIGVEAATGAPLLTAVEHELAEIWTQLLQRPQERRDELFFDAGGHSLLALDMIAEVRKRYGVTITPLDILMSTLEQLAARIESGLEPEKADEAVEAEEPALVEVSLDEETQEVRKPGIIGLILRSRH